MSFRSTSSRSPLSGQSQLTSKSDSSNKLMNRKQLQSVIVSKFIKDYPQLDEQTISNAVQDFMLKLDTKINELNLKQLKNIIKELALEQISQKKQMVVFKLSNSQSTISCINDQKSQSSIESIRDNKFNQVKKVNYPSLNQNYRAGQSLSPKNLSTLSSFKENSNNLAGSTQLSLSNESNKIQNIQMKEFEKNKISSSQDLQCPHQQSVQSVGIKSILKKANRSLSPQCEKRIPPLNDLQKQNSSSTLQQIKSNPLNQEQQPPLPTITKPSLKKDDKLNEGQLKYQHSSEKQQNEIQQQIIEENEKKSTKYKQILLDDSIKDIQKKQLLNVLGLPLGKSNKNSYWSYLDKVQHKDFQQIKCQNQNEWKDKFEEIKNIRQEHQIQGDLKKQNRNVKSVQSDYESDEDSLSQITCHETVKGFDYNRQKGNLLETISQQQYIDINYAEIVKKNAENLEREKQQQRARKKDIQKYLKECYDEQVIQKQVDKKEEIQRGKEFIVFQKIIEEQEQREKHNQDINNTIKQARKQELKQKEQDRQLNQNKKLNTQAETMEKCQKDLKYEQEQIYLRKKKEFEFYQNAIKEYQQENRKVKKKVDEKEQDKFYMQNYTNYLDEQEEQRLMINQQRQRELQEFLKKQAESHQKFKEKKIKEEERQQMKQILNEYVESNIQEIKDQAYYKKQLQGQLRDFLTQQIEEKKEIQQKNFIDYDKIQLKACQKYNDAQNQYENQINELKKQQEIENFQFLKEQIKQNQLKNTKYFYPLAYSSILEQKNQKS
ncbi:hypothetical protein TTHERM_00301960 (macronuclear) [Tetrahymena thermophila SB210]|uniref:Uncharacterized protein n=1 Tax=Tetrahymena thermophila (strain SB210) TaxID=312017 RepID=I7MM89_TETTS|nr:hypothetical protein TTHERM_00301960 [Tetrahymena thermophila SB210]EAS04379.1 hypothetical protein TTHERM_00301960 [Tetrahymena thermophila SB210]|eukprot:XP_001024624.1 hypothetical protein TTHERM_00301960 [Tetrahymena thermophila SB210]